MFWTIGKFPELDHLEPGQRAFILASVPLWTYPVMLGRSLLAGVVAGGIVVGLSIGASGPSQTAIILALPVLALTAIATYAIQISRLRAAMRQSIADEFEGVRPPFCFECGYDLRGSVAAKCPECGQDFSAGAGGEASASIR